MRNVSVVIPALNEEHTVGRVVSTVLASEPGEVIVIDADSTDNTRGVAAAAGARVLNWREVLPDIPPVAGKGESLWRGVAAARGDIVVFIDADLRSLDEHVVPALAAPFEDPDVALVKADYNRTFEGKPTGGGRVTELTAKPLLRVFFPELGHINQPLGGEYAIRRSVAQQLPFVGGYGVEVGLIIDVLRSCGPDSIRQVHLNDRVHRNRPLNELSRMADVVATTILSRAHALDIEVPQRPPLAGI